MVAGRKFRCKVRRTLLEDALRRLFGQGALLDRTPDVCLLASSQRLLECVLPFAHARISIADLVKTHRKGFFTTTYVDPTTAIWRD